MRREDLEGADATEVTPVVAVGRCDEKGVVVTEVLGLEGARAVREDDVVLRETFFNGGRR